jgi:hypothetical protein
MTVETPRRYDQYHHRPGLGPNDGRQNSLSTAEGCKGWVVLGLGAWG